MPEEGQVIWKSSQELSIWSVFEVVVQNNSLTVKLLTNANFVNFFKKVFLAKLLVSYHGREVLCNFCFIQISAEKSPDKAKTANFDGLFGPNIF